MGYRASTKLQQFRHTTYLDYCSEKRDEFKSTIWNEFPMPIAYSFYRAEHGYENYNQRLDFLKDTWESLVAFIFAMVIGEYRCLGLSMEGTNIKMSHVLSDSLSAKLLVAEQLLQKSKDDKYKLESSKIIPLDVIGNIRTLNQVRNGFSHQAAKSETQAASIFSDHFDEVFDILQKLQGLKDVTLMRFFYAGSDALKPRFETCSARMCHPHQRFRKQ